MKKFGRVIALLFAVVFVGVFFTGCGGGNPYEGAAKDNSLEITALNVDITVDNDRTATVTETYTVLYHTMHLGISRYLPVNSGETYSDIEVKGDVYFIETNVNYITVNTGAYDYSSGKVYQSGESATYTLSYRMVPPVRSAGNTNYYMNVVGQGWSIRQSNVSVSLKMPRTIKDALIYYGRWGSDATLGDDSYSIAGDTLRITVPSLEAYNGITVNLETDKRFAAAVDWAIVAFIAALFIAALVFWLLFSKVIKNREITPVVNFYPPEENGRRLTPAELGFIIDNKAEADDITSMIFYLASRGYIDIRDGEPMTLLKKREIGDNESPEAKTVFKALFARGGEVTTDQLTNKFYVTIAAAGAQVKSKYAGKLYKKSPIKYLFGFIAALLSVGGFLLIGARLQRSYFSLAGLGPILLVLLALFTGTAAAYRQHKISRAKRVSSYIGQIVVGFALSAVLAYFTSPGAARYIYRLLLYFGAFAAALAASCILRRTDYYSDLLDQVLGFREFLVSVEKERLELLIDENPDYYYDILPYANVLGVSDVWMDKFEGLKLEPPSYYYSENLVFDIIMFNAFYRHSFMALRTAAISRPSSGGGFSGGGFGGFGGGGFSGGGFGGGGGGGR